MSTKENIDFIKKELSNEEKFLETSMKMENFWKKYKVLVLSSAVVIGLGVIGYFANESFKQKDLIASNEAYAKLLKNPEDTTSLDILKSKNEKLYNIFQFQQAIQSADIKQLESIASKNIDIYSSLAQLEVALLKKDLDALTKYTYKDKALLKDYASLQEAFLLIEKKDYKKAKTRLDSISSESTVANFANTLKHYLIIKG
jgi:hypothetical protein